MADRVARIFIDSQFKTVELHSDSDFRIDLPFAVDVEAGSRIRVDSLLLSHGWPSVELGVNDTLYLREVSDGTAYHRLLTLPVGSYSIGTLAVAIQTQLRSETHISDGIWTVSSQDGQLTLHQSSPIAAAIL